MFDKYVNDKSQGSIAEHLRNDELHTLLHIYQ